MNLNEIAVREITRLYNEKMFSAIGPLLAAYTTQHMTDNAIALRVLFRESEELKVPSYQESVVQYYSASSRTEVRFTGDDIKPYTIVAQPAFCLDTAPTPERIIEIISAFTKSLDRMLNTILDQYFPNTISHGTTLQQKIEGTELSKTLTGFIYVPSVTNDCPVGMFDDKRLAYGFIRDTNSRYRIQDKDLYYYLMVPIQMYINL